jgi:hypothetical protein
MAGAKVRWRLARERFEVIDHGDLWFDDSGDIIGSADVAEPASLTEFRHALDRYRATMYDGEFELRVYDAPPELLEDYEEHFEARQESVEFAHEHTFVVIVVAVGPQDHLDRWETTGFLSPLLAKHGGMVAEFSEDRQPTAAVYRLVVEINPRRRTVGDALAIGADLRQLWEAALFGGLSPATVADLLRAQRPEILIGQPETTWFEAKQAPYCLTDPLQAAELAKDVSALANNPEGGLLVIGLMTRKRGGVDTVTRVRAQPVEMLRARRYRQAIHKWVFPPIEDLAVETVKTESDQGLLFVLVPSQPDSLRPFLVTGAVREGKLLGSHFSLVRRRDDESVATDPVAIHGQMLAGRVALAAARTPQVGEETGDVTDAEPTG